MWKRKDDSDDDKTLEDIVLESMGTLEEDILDEMKTLEDDILDNM